ncbi:MAG: hypothetical protein K2X27_15155, partial [Candidatus Obscuribacterales bacterium]|nr:hypothetical protein [Candidatus Obscuribacterales bacterium]
MESRGVKKGMRAAAAKFSAFFLAQSIFLSSVAPALAENNSEAAIPTASELIKSGNLLALQNIIAPDREQMSEEKNELKPAAEEAKTELAQISPESSPAFAAGRIVSDPEASPSAIEDLTKQIMLKEIALEKFNLRYKMNVAKQGRWKGWRYSAASEANSILGLTGGIISTYNRGIHVHRSSQVKTYVQEDANIIPMIGSIIGASAAAMEFCINEYHEYKAWKKGFSATAAKKHVNGLKADINRLMAERDALVRLEKSAPLLAPQAEVHELEGRVLRDLRDQGLLEFQRFHLGAKRLLAFQQMQYFFDFGTNVSNAIGCDFAYLSLHRHRRVWNYRAGVFFAISGGLQMGGPIFSRLWAKSVSEYHKRGLKETMKDAEAREVAMLQKDEADLENLCKQQKCSPDK